MSTGLKVTPPPIRPTEHMVQLAHRIPEGNIKAVAYAHLFGPKDATTPEGHPIMISTGVFDATVSDPARAIARAAYKWFKIGVYPPHWTLEMEEDVIHPANRPRIHYDKVFYFRYEPEIWKWEHRGLVGKVHNHLMNSHYLTKRWQKKESV